MFNSPSILICGTLDTTNKIKVCLGEAYNAFIVNMISCQGVRSPDIAILNYDWIIFTSKNGYIHLANSQKQQLRTDGVKIAVVGKETASLIIKDGASVDFMPSEYHAQALYQTLPIEHQETAIVVAGSLFNPSDTVRLKERCLGVDYIIVYENIANVLSKSDIENVQGQAWDCVVFTSSSATESFLNQKILSTKELKQTNIISIGPSTTRYLHSQGFETIREAKEHSAEGVSNLIKEIYASTTSPTQT